jgi:hypothetical protein
LFDPLSLDPWEMDSAITGSMVDGFSRCLQYGESRGLPTVMMMIIVLRTGFAVSSGVRITHLSLRKIWEFRNVQHL